MQEEDESGNYISRTLAEMALNGRDLSCCWNTVDGPRRLTEQMIELFAAGNTH